MINIKELLEKGPLILDGATGTNLQQMGMPSGVCPEQWMLRNPEMVISLARAYIQAGSDIIYAPTFAANRIKLSAYALEDQVVPMNRALVELAKTAVEKEGTAGSCLIAGNLTMTGQTLAPLGTLDFETLVDCYKEQAQAIADAGVDLFIIETMMHIGEARAALLAVKEVCDLPVMVTMSVEKSGKTMYGTDAAAALVTLESMGADAVGLNCSCGPDLLLPIIQRMKAYATVPLIVKPNAGLPKLVDGRTVYDMDKETYVRHMKALVAAGAAIVGGCCGTTPEYIRLLKDTLKEMPAFIPQKESVRVLTGERVLEEIDLDGPLTVIGERINPTGKKKLQQALLDHSLDIVQSLAETQVADGARILDVNVGMRAIDERQMMLEVIDAVNACVNTVLCIDSSDPLVVEAALRRYHGRALVNSVSCEKVKLKKLLPVIKKYGAMFIMLPLTDEGLPKDFAERRDNLQAIMKAAQAVGLHKEDMAADGLVATLGANPAAGRDTLETIAYCHDVLGIATVCGLSNISFGLPERAYINSTFLALAISKGLTMAIANPSQELLMHTLYAADLLMNKPEASMRYIGHIQGDTMAEASAETSAGGDAGSGNVGEVLQSVYDNVLKGKKKLITDNILAALKMGADAQEILNDILIPAITEVGQLFNDQKYYLPQLLISAETMQLGVQLLKPHLSTDVKEAGAGVIVIATVQGDIHDIGKNLVAMMLRNYGFQVIDLGKDVTAKEIVDAARKHSADVIALSALMTTTMERMKEVVALVKSEGLPCKVIIGGAVITEDFARDIGADGYSEDAVAAVALVRRLLENS